MTAYNVQKQNSDASQTKSKLGVIGLVALPVAAAMYSSGGLSIQEIPAILTSGVFPIAFTLLSWGLAAKIALKLRK